MGSLRRAGIFVVIASLAAGCTSQSTEPVPDVSEATYVGRDVCASCHADETAAWEGSHHDLAMKAATDESVLGDFGNARFDHRGETTSFLQRDGGYYVSTRSASGDPEELEVAFTFGADPLQQYLLRLPGGRYQAFGVAWDARPPSDGGGRWFHLYPDDELAPGDRLHWASRYQNWNLMCASCHSTGLRKNYDPVTDSYETSWSEPNVSCEACHGPGSNHVEWARSGAPEGDPVLTPLAADRATWVMDLETGLSERSPPRTEHYEIETCAPCHSRRSQFGESDALGQPYLDDYRPALLTDGLYYPDGQIRDEVYVYGSFLQSRMYAKGVTCQDCHEPHSLAVKGGASEVCASCHLVDKFDASSHHFHEADSVTCVDCHMPETTYMSVDPRRDHSFRVPRPDLTVRTGSPNACGSCHGDQGPEWAVDAVREWYGHEPPRHYGDALHAAWTGRPGAGELLAAAANDPETPAIVKATVASMAPTPAALSSPDPLIRLGGLLGAGALDPALRHQLVVPLLDDDIRAVRLEAARALASIPIERFTPSQRQTLERGLDEFRSAMALNADWPETHLTLALLELDLGRPEAAEAELRTALSLDPAFGEAYINLSDLERARGDERAAEAALREGLERVDDTADLHHALGLTLVRLERGEEARAELALARELRPENARYAYVYGVALHGDGRTDDAVRVLADAAELHPNDVDLRVALLTVERDRGNLTAALTHARRLLELRPGDRQLRQLVLELDQASRR